MSQPDATTRNGMPIVPGATVYAVNALGDAVTTTVVGAIVADPTTGEARVYAEGRLLFPADCWADEGLARAARAEEPRRLVAFLRQRLTEAGPPWPPSMVPSHRDQNGGVEGSPEPPARRRGRARGARRRA